MTDFKQTCTESRLKIDKAARETFNMLKPAFEEAAMSKNQVNLIGVTSSKIE
jgi:hypothetical protein